MGRLSVGLSGRALELRPDQFEGALVALGPDEGHERHEPEERDHHGIDDGEDDEGSHLREEGLHAEVPFDSDRKCAKIKSYSFILVDMSSKRTKNMRLFLKVGSARSILMAQFPYMKSPAPQVVMAPPNTVPAIVSAAYLRRGMRSAGKGSVSVRRF